MSGAGRHTEGGAAVQIAPGEAERAVGGVRARARLTRGIAGLQAPWVVEGLSGCSEHCESEEKWNGVVAVAGVAGVGVERKSHDY